MNSIFPRDWVESGPLADALPDGWHAARFPTIMSGRVIRFYRGDDRDDANEIVNVSRDGIALASGVCMCGGAAVLDEVRTVLDLAEHEADRLCRDRGSWRRREW